jgi:hypothetical protein
MSPMDAAAVVLLLALPLHWLVLREMDRLSDPAYLRANAVVIVNSSVLRPSAPMGHYRGHPVWASVRFMGMEYRFDRVQDRKARERLAPGELFLDPGLVYVVA